MTVTAARRSLAGVGGQEAAFTLGFVALETLVMIVVAALVPKVVGTHAETPSAWGVIGVVAVAFTASRWLGTRDVAGWRRVALGVLITIAALQILGRADLSESARFWDFRWLLDLADPDSEAWRRHGRLDHFFAGLALIPLWFRGVALGSRDLRERSLLPVALVGFGVLAFGFLVGDAAGILTTVRICALAFVIVGLATIAFRNASRLQAGASASFGQTGLSFAAMFGVLAAGIVIFILLITAVVTLVAGSGVAEPVADLLGDVLHGIALGLGYLFYPLFWVIERIFALFQSETDPQELQELFGGTGRPFAPDERTIETDPTAGIVLVRVFGAIGVILLVLLLAALAFRQLRKRRDSGDEDRESLWSEADLLGDLMQGLRGLGNRFRRTGRLHGAADAPIAELYLELLRDAEARGTSRPAARTPLQFAPVLRRKYASALPVEISERFSQFRYAGVNPPEPDMRRLREAWQALLKAQV